MNLKNTKKLKGYTMNQLIVMLAMPGTMEKLIKKTKLSRITIENQLFRVRRKNFTFEWAYKKPNGRYVKEYMLTKKGEKIIKLLGNK